MANLTIGDFTDRAWTLNSQHSSDNGILITQTAMNIEISRANNPNDRIAFLKSQGLDFRSTTFGGRYVLILEFYTSNNQMKRQKIYLINTIDGHGLTKITIFDTGQIVPTLRYPNNPFVSVSLGNSEVFHMYTEDQLQKAKGLAFYRSDNGSVICPASGQAEVQLSGGLRIRGRYDGIKLKMFTNSLQQVLPLPCSLLLVESTPAHKRTE